MKFQIYWDYGIDLFEGNGDMGSAIDRIKSKALQAKGVVPRVLTSVETGLDEIIAAEQELEAKKNEALAPHLSAIAETKTELEDIRTALDIMSNGGPPLEPSTTVSKSSEATPVAPFDHSTGDPIKT